MQDEKYLKAFWGDEIRRIREKTLKLSQEEFGAILGVDQGQISRYENGVCEPPEDVVRSIVRISKDNALLAKYLGDQELDKEKGWEAMRSERALDVIPA